MLKTNLCKNKVHESLLFSFLHLVMQHFCNNATNWQLSLEVVTNLVRIKMIVVHLFKKIVMFHIITIKILLYIEFFYLNKTNLYY